MFYVVCLYASSYSRIVERKSSLPTQSRFPSAEDSYEKIKSEKPAGFSTFYLLSSADSAHEAAWVGASFCLGDLVGKSADFPDFVFLSSADGAQEAFPARPLVNRPPFKGETVVNDMVSPLKIPLPAGCRRK